jgi:hypothetical protein
MTLLTTEPPHLGHRDPLDADAVKAALYFIQLMRPDDRINALHHEPFYFLESSAIAKA